MRCIPAIAIATIIIMSGWASAAETTTIRQIIYIDPEDEDEFDNIYNFSDSANHSLTNYNATIVPFLNESGIEGTFTGGFLPPITVLLSNDTSMTGNEFIGLTRFKSDWIMSGSSYSWWRVPILNLSDWTKLQFEIWHLDNPELLNMTAQNEPNEVTHPYLIFDNEYSPASGYNTTYRHHNITAWNYTYNFTWLRIVAPIHSDEFYFVKWTITEASISNVSVIFSQNDIGDDQISQSWFDNGTLYEFSIDLDISVIHQFGMGHTVSGFDVNIQTLPFDNDSITESLSPSGTNNGFGGTLDGDWTIRYGTGSINIDSTDKMAGQYSIYSSLTSTAARQASIKYSFDESQDFTNYVRIKFWIKVDYPYFPNEYCRFHIHTTLGTSGFYHDFTPTELPDNTWSFINIAISDLTQYSGGDITDINYFDLYFDSSGSGTLNYEIRIDMLHFEYYTEPSIIMYSRLSEAVTQSSDTITFMMPFMKDITNESNVRVNIRNENASWSRSYWVAEDGPTDFALKSWQWTNSYSEDFFYIMITFQNQSNSIFVWDCNSEFHPQFDDTSTNRTNRFTVNNHDWAPYGYYFYFRPYHALQKGDGYWTNTNIDPLYYLDGKIVNLTDIQFKDTSKDYPWYIYIIYVNVMLPYALYTFTDKFILRDVLPDLNKTKYLAYRAQNYYNFKEQIESNPIYQFIHTVTIKFAEIIDWIIEYAPYLFTLIMKGFALILGVPIFIAAVLITNGVKRFAVILSADGVEAAVDYASNFFKNAFHVVSGPRMAAGKIMGVVK